MTSNNIAHVETSLIETLLSGIDASESARRSGSSMLVYLADMMVKRAREELAAMKSRHPLSESCTESRDCSGQAGEIALDEHPPASEDVSAAKPASGTNALPWTAQSILDASHSTPDTKVRDGNTPLCD